MEENNESCRNIIKNARNPCQIFILETKKLLIRKVKIVPTIKATRRKAISWGAKKMTARIKHWASRPSIRQDKTLLFLEIDAYWLSKIETIFIFWNYFRHNFDREKNLIHYLHWADASSAGCAELCAGETAGHGLSDAGRHA